MRTEISCPGFRALLVNNFDLRLTVVKVFRPPIKSLTCTFSFEGELFSVSVFFYLLKGLLDWQMLYSRAVLLLSV